MVGGAAEDGRVEVVQPAARRYRAATDHGLGWLRQGRALFCLPLRRPRAGPHQDVDHPPRQHLERRLGRPEPGRARHRADVLPSAGQSQRHSARHDQHAGGERRHLAGLDLGQRRPYRRQGLHGRDSSAAPDDPLRWRRRRADGDPLLAAHQPHRRVGVVAGARARLVGVPEAFQARILESRAAADARADSVRRVHAQPGAGRAGRVGGGRRRQRFRHQREMGTLVHDHARRHRQSRLQPGRERRLPGGSQSAVPDLLLREAPVLHGRRRAVQSRRQRAGGRVDALRRAHPADCRPDLRRQADRLFWPRHVRQPHRRRPVAGPDHRSARSPEWRREAVPGGAGAGPAQYRQFRRRDGDVHRAGRPHQCRRRRRSQPAFQGLEQPDGVRARLEHRRWRRRGAGHRAAGELRIQLATGQRAEPGRALRPRVRDGHRVHEPCRLHVGLGLHRLQLLSRQGPLSVGPQDFPVHLRCRADAIASRAATTTSSSAASA